MLAVPHGMSLAGPMNSGGPVMGPPPPPQLQNPQVNGPNGNVLTGAGHHTQANSPTDAMQQAQNAGGGGNNIVGVNVSGGAGTAGPNQAAYYGPPTTSQMPNVADAKFNAALNNAGPGGGVQQPHSPHLQQNGYVTGGVAPSNYGQQVGGGGNVGANGPQSGTQTNPGGQVVSGGTVGAGGTWTGSSTLTYTQSMQPPDPRTHSTGYCNV